MPVHHVRRGRNFQTYNYWNTVSPTHSAATGRSSNPTTSAVPISTTFCWFLSCCILLAPYSSQSLAFLVFLPGITNTKSKHHYCKLSFTSPSNTSKTSRTWSSSATPKWLLTESFCSSRKRNARSRKKTKKGWRRQPTVRIQESADRAISARLETWTSVPAGWSLTWPSSTKTTSETSPTWNDVYSLH